MPHQPRKRFGQNFLVDEKIITQIILTISPKHNDNIIEIIENDDSRFDQTVVCKNKKFTIRS